MNIHFFNTLALLFCSNFVYLLPGQMNGQVEVRHDGIPAPKKVLYPPDKITLTWQRSQRVGPGLINMGNTCFLNATLQCLTYTPPLANYLLSHQHKTECKKALSILKELLKYLGRSCAIWIRNTVHSEKLILSIPTWGISCHVNTCQ